MRFFLDFEAARFSNQIISVGCITEDGKTFYSLLKSHKKVKIDNFITELTGITNEMLNEAPNANEVFSNLYDFIIENSDDNIPKFYVYGSSDKGFITATINHINDTKAYMCAKAIQNSLIDYSRTVKDFFLSNREVALRKIYMLINHIENYTQNHNALEDAEMLRVVVTSMKENCKPEDKEAIFSIESQRPKTEKPKSKNAPPIYLSWRNQPKWETNTNADETNWVLKYNECNSNNVKYFDSHETAALWIIKYVARNISPKDPSKVNRVQKNINEAIRKGKNSYNGFWEYNKEGEEE